MFQIGQFSKMCGLTIETLRHYDRIGLLRPAHVHPQTGYRLYDASQLMDAYRILAFRDAGFRLREMPAKYPETPGDPAFLHALEQKAQQMQAALEAQRDRLHHLWRHIFLWKNGGIPMMNEITIKAVAPILVCSQRRVIAKKQFDEALEIMWPAVNNAIAQGKGQKTIPCLMLYHNRSWTFEDSELDIEVAEPLAARFAAQDDVTIYELPATPRMACVVHQGPFSTMGQTYKALMTWIDEHGLAITGPAREIYHQGDWAVDDPEQYITEIQMPVS